ncbi:MAG: hypothetical protein GY838_02830 [bacterium]|nr:hypothetical protein [bacterium]
MSARRRLLCALSLLWCVGSLSLSPSVASAQEARIFEQSAWANAFVASPCPFDHPSATQDDAVTEDLTAFTASVMADTASACGDSYAEASIATALDDSTIVVDFACHVDLTEHIYAESGAHFLVRFRLSEPVDYTLHVTGSFAYQDTLTNFACGVSFGDYHGVSVDQPTLDVTTTGSLAAGEAVYTLEGHCNAVRNVRYLAPGWEWEDGSTTLTGSVMLTLHRATVVPQERTSWSDSRMLFR